MKGLTPILLCILLIPISTAQAQIHDDPGLTITDVAISTGHDKVPRFCNEPNATGIVRNIKGGAWSDPSVWSSSVVPAAGAKVQIIGGTSVTYDRHSAAVIQCVEVHGVLEFRNDIDTALWLEDGILVMPSGSLRIGDLQDPISADVSAEIVFTDTPLKIGTIAAPGIDSGQYGRGLLVFGKLEIHGHGIDRSFIRLAQEAKAGDLTLKLVEAPSSWRSGDRLLLPDTRQIPFRKRFSTLSHAEEMILAEIDGTVVTLEAPLRFDHLGPRNRFNEISREMLAHLIHLSRNVAIRSESSEVLLRGHMMSFHQADVDVRYAHLKALGRTTTAPLDSRISDQNGNLSHIGTNQIGRYSLHMHHVFGPVNPTNTGFQFEIVGNFFDGGEKWGIAIHDTHFGSIRHNVVYDVKGSAIVTEQGNETENVFEHNVVVGIRAGENRTADRDFTRGGIRDNGKDSGFDHSAFWFRGPYNVVRHNAAWNQDFAGYVYNGYYLNPRSLRFPSFRGSLLVEEGSYFQLPKGEAIALLESRDNEVHASSLGIYASWYAGCCSVGWYKSEGVFSDYRMSHINRRGVYGYHNAGTTFDGFVMLNDEAVSNQNMGGSRINSGFFFNNVSYENGRLVVRNFEVSDFNCGIQLSPNLNDGTDGLKVGVIERGVLQNHINILIPLPTYSKGQEYFLRGVDFEALLPDPALDLRQPAPNHIVTYPAIHKSSNPMALQRVYVQDYDQEPGKDFEVFFTEQGPNEIVLPPQRDAYLNNPLKTCPEQGITEQECWNRYGVALSGQVAPCVAQDGDPNCIAALNRAASLRVRGLTFDVSQTPSRPEEGFDIALDWLSVDGNILAQGSPDAVADFLDDFDDGALDTLPTSFFTQVSPLEESAGFLRFRDTDGALLSPELAWDAVVLQHPLSDGGGNSEITASFRIESLDLGQLYGIGVGDPDGEVVWLCVLLGPADTWVLVLDGAGTLAVDVMTESRAGLVSVKLFIDDTTNQVVASYSSDNGTSFKDASQFHDFQGHGTIFGNAPDVFVWAFGGLTF